MSEKKVSIAVAKRLPKYYRYLGEILDKGITRISSNELSQRMNITASQIRQDLNNFGSFGLQGYGYNVELLYKEIGRILGLDKEHKLVVIGAGNIGHALIKYDSFESRGFKIVGIFDKDADLIGSKIKDLEVQHVDKLKSYLTDNKIDVVVLTVPQTSVKSILDIINESTIEGVWNFTHMELSLREGIKVENVQLMDSLMTLSYKVNEDEIIKRYNGTTKLKEQYYKPVAKD